MGPIDTYQHFLELLERHRGIVWERCWRYSDGDFDRCRDLVQEVTLHLCLHRGDLRPDVSENEEREWLTLLTRRTLHNLHRRKGGDPRRLATALGELSGDDPRQPARELAQEMIGTLPEDDRWIMQQRFDGYSNEEIATALGTTPSNISHRIQRITKTLKQRFNP